MAFNFELGKPFHPYEQLMGVLPVASMEHIPSAYRVCTSQPRSVFLFLLKCIKDLMYDPNSPILDFYPLEFEQDLNGKKAEWEAIVKIPFIDEERLLKAMACGSRCIVFTFFCLTWPLYPSSGASLNTRRKAAKHFRHKHAIFIQPWRTNRLPVFPPWVLPISDQVYLQNGTIRSPHT